MSCSIELHDTTGYAWAMEAAESEDIGVLALSLADRLHKARIVQFLPQAKQLRKAR